MATPAPAPSPTTSPDFSYISPANMQYPPTTNVSDSDKVFSPVAVAQPQASLQDCMYALDGEWVCNTRAAGPLNKSIIRN